MKKIIIVVFMAVVLLFTACATPRKDTFERTYDVSHPDKTVAHYIEIIQTYSPSLLREVMHFEGRREREYLITQIHQEIIPQVTSPGVDRFHEMTNNPVGIHVVDSIQVTDDFYLYLVHFNQPNLIYGLRPDVLDFLRVKRYGDDWLIEVDFTYEEVTKESELTEEDPVTGPLEFELWKLENERRELRRQSPSEVVLRKTKAEAKYEIMRQNKDDWEGVPNYQQIYNYWRHQRGVYAGMSPSDLQNYLLTELDRQIESTRNLLRR